jgi:molybdopterin molybdotransferase
VFVTFLIFARPVILKKQGAEKYNNVFTNVRADFEWPAGKRQEYLRVRLEHASDGYIAKLFPHQGSGVLSSACWADGLIEVNVDQQIKRGDMVKYLPFEGLY